MPSASPVSEPTARGGRQMHLDEADLVDVDRELLDSAVSWTSARVRSVDAIHLASAVRVGARRDVGVRQPSRRGRRGRRARGAQPGRVRIIAGSHRGARIAAPKGLATRPTGDRVREAAFNLIGPVDDARVLDLYAGSGAMGIEALSRGAANVTFVESDRAACSTISANLEKLKLTGAKVVCADAVWTVRRDTRTYDLVLVDPPYELWAELEPKLAEHLPRVLAPDGVLVVETGSRTEPSLPLPLRTSRRYGSARLTLFAHP